MEKMLAMYVAFLRAVALTHQNNHWTCSGSTFYAHHLMFERIYNSAQENADAAAERVVGLLGSGAIVLTTQAKDIAEMLKQFDGKDEELIANSIAIETQFLEFSQKMYDSLDKSGKMSLGLDDLIMSIASDREAALYLLKQSLSA